MESNPNGNEVEKSEAIGSVAVLKTAAAIMDLMLHMVFDGVWLVVCVSVVGGFRMAAVNAQAVAAAAAVRARKISKRMVYVDAENTPIESGSLAIVRLSIFGFIQSRVAKRKAAMEA